MLDNVVPLPILQPEAEQRESKLLFGLDRAALGKLIHSLGEPRFRAGQIAEAIYRQRVDSIEGISTLAKNLRQKLVDAGWQVGRPRIDQAFTASDGTERYLMACHDGQTVETVWMPEGDDGEDENDGEEAATGFRRATLCISSQVGCAVNCQFCLTARLGWTRNLSAGEICGQVLSALERHGVDVSKQRINLVFMGMGEPFLNYDNFMAAVRLLVEEAGLSPRRMTVSTAGILPGIERFAAEPAELRPKLALSLNAPSDEQRSAIMPINRKWAIEELLAALRRIPLRPGERVTFEYVLLGGVNDSHDDAQRLAKLLRRANLAAKVNLIAWNPGPGPGYQSPSPEAVEAFRKQLVSGGIPAYQRKPRGREIYAACGQLKRTVEG